jgi:hypothetical protein
MRNVSRVSLRHPSLLLVALGLMAAACGVKSSSSGGSGGEGGSSGGEGGSKSTPGGCYDYTGFDGTTPTVTFKADVLPIFQASCGLSMACHGENPPVNPSAPFLGPALPTTASSSDISAIITGIVGATSADNPPMDIVAKGSPENSFMMYKLDTDPANAAGVTCSTLACVAAASCLTGMPLDGTQLSAAERDTSRRGIAQGASGD